MDLKISFPGFKDAKIKEFPGSPVGVHGFTVGGPGLIPDGKLRYHKPCTAAKKGNKCCFFNKKIEPGNFL